MKAPAFVAIAWLLAGCSEKSDTSPTSSNPPATNASAPMNAPAGYLGALQKGQQTAVKTIDTIKRFSYLPSRTAAIQKV